MRFSLNFERNLPHNFSRSLLDFHFVLCLFFSDFFVADQPFKNFGSLWVSGFSGCRERIFQVGALWRNIFNIDVVPYVVRLKTGGN